MEAFKGEIGEIQSEQIRRFLDVQSGFVQEGHTFLEKVWFRATGAHISRTKNIKLRQTQFYLCFLLFFYACPAPLLDTFEPILWEGCSHKMGSNVLSRGAGHA